MTSIVHNRSFIMTIGILTAAIVLLCLISMRGTVEVVEKGLDQLPYHIGPWFGRDIPMDQRIVYELDTDVYVNRLYSSKSPNSSPIALYLGYYGTNKGGRTSHNPYACFPSQGWAIIEEKKIPVQVSSRSHKEKVIFVNRLLVKSNERRQLVYHWYQSGGDNVLSSGIEQNINRFWNRIIFNRNDGAFIQLTAVLRKDETMSDKTFKEFVKVLFSLIAQHWPTER